jgi:hypothetical protein
LGKEIRAFAGGASSGSSYAGLAVDIAGQAGGIHEGVGSRRAGCIACVDVEVLGDSADGLATHAVGRQPRTLRTRGLARLAAAGKGVSVVACVALCEAGGRGRIVVLS